MTEHYAGDDRNVETLAGGVLAAYAGVSVEEFEARADAFLRAARHPTLGRGYLECAYAPMVELLALLAANGFTNYVVSGGGRDFMRPITQEVYGIPRERVIGSATALAYTSDERGGTITHTPAPDYRDDGPEKPIRIWSAPAADRYSRPATPTAISRCSTSRGTTTSRSCACWCSTTTQSASSPTPAAPSRRSNKPAGTAGRRSASATTEPPSSDPPTSGAQPHSRPLRLTARTSQRQRALHGTEQRERRCSVRAKQRMIPLALPARTQAGTDL
jgi:hypothetical protein